MLTKGKRQDTRVVDHDLIDQTELIRRSGQEAERGAENVTLVLITENENHKKISETETNEICDVPLKTSTLTRNITMLVHFLNRRKHLNQVLRAWWDQNPKIL